MRKYSYKNTKGRLRVSFGIIVPLLLLLSTISGFVIVQLFPGESFNATGVNEQMNFQARLLNDEGAVVPDGDYNIRFKIYQDGDGCVSAGSSPCSGTLEWTETRTGADQVRVKNGYFSVYLGSVNSFDTDVDWDQDTLWLSLDIGGTGGSPSWDGEMLPFTRLSSTPYSLNSGRLNGLTKDELVQLGQGLQVDSSTNAGIAVNKTGASGNILQLQRGGSDVVLIDNDGDAIFQTTSDSQQAFQVRTSGGTAVLDVDTSNQRVGINTTTPDASFQVQAAGATEIASIVQAGSASQTADLQQFMNNSDDILGRVDAGGNIVAALDPPSTTATAAVDATSGNLDGDYTYVVTFVTAHGETFAGPASDTVSPSSEQVDLSDIPVGPTGTKSRKIYRTTAHTDGVTTDWRFLTEIADNTTTTYDDNTADTSLTYAPPMPVAAPQAAPLASTNGLQVGSLTGDYTYAISYITPWGETPASPDSNTLTTSSNYVRLSHITYGGVKNVTGVRVYRTEAGGSDLYYNPTLHTVGTTTDIAGVLTDPSESKVDDDNTDGNLNTDIVPVTSANTSNQPDAPSASIIASLGNLTEDADYVWAYSYVNASGAESALSSFSDVVTPDSSDQQASITGIDAGPPGTVARKLYRSARNQQGSNHDPVQGPFFLVATIGDNTTTSYTDNISDYDLTVSRPAQTGFVGSGIKTNNITLSAPQGTPPIRVTSTTQVDNLNAELLGGSDQLGIKDFTYNMDESLKHFRQALSNSNNEAVVVNFMGDSITWGLNLSDRVTRSFPALVGKQLKEKYGDGGSGFSKPWDNRLWEEGGNGTYNFGGTSDLGGGMTVCNDDATPAQISTSFYGSQVSIQYTDNFLLYDTFEYSIDNGTKTGSVNTGTTAGSVGNRETITGLDPNKEHTITISVTNSSEDECVLIEGIDATLDTGVRVNNLATSSSTSVGAFDNDSPAINVFDPKPDLVVLGYGTNEQGTSLPGFDPSAFKLHMQKFISHAKSSDNPASCVLVIPGPQDSDTSQRFNVGIYRDIYYQLADENDCGVLDLYRKWNSSADWAVNHGLYSDGLGGDGEAFQDTLHLSDKGHADVASSLLGFLDRGVKTNNSLTVDTSYSQNGGTFSLTQLSAPENLRNQNTSAVPDGSLTASDTYLYRVTALNSTGESAPSDQVELTVQTSAYAEGNIGMRWNEVPGATAYRVYRCASANCVDGTPLSQYVQVTKPSLIDTGGLSWVTNATVPTSSYNSSFGGAQIQGTNSSAFGVANGDSADVIRVDTSVNQYNLIGNSGFEKDPTDGNMLNNPSFEDTSGNWEGSGSATYATSGDYVYRGSHSGLVVTTAAADDGLKYDIELPDDTEYELTFFARTLSGSGSILEAGYASDGSTETDCSLDSSSIDTSWTRYTCIVDSGTVSGTPYLYIKQTDATSRYIFVDEVSFKPVTAPTGWEVLDTTENVYRTESMKYAGRAGMQFGATASSGDGVKYPITLTQSTTYTLTFYTRSTSTLFGSLQAGYAADGSTESNCSGTGVALTNAWYHFTCTITPGAISGSPYLYIKQSSGAVNAIYVDSISLVEGTTAVEHASGVISFDGIVDSPMLFRAGENTSRAFRVQDASGTDVFNVNTQAGQVEVADLTVSGDATFSGAVDLGYGSQIGDGTASLTSILKVVDEHTSSENCNFGCYGLLIDNTVTNPTNPTSATGLRIDNGSGAASFTLANAYGIFVASTSEGSGSTITTNYGILVQAQSVGDSDYGIAVQAADTRTLWLSSNADNTTASAGIAFGASEDTNLYRGAADTLQTDDDIVLNGGNLVTSNLGVEFTDSDTNPSCSAGEYKIYADTSETKLKKCENGSASDIGSAGGGSTSLITSGGSGSTSSDSGLELDGSDVGLLQGCSDAQILKWDDTAAEWECASNTSTYTSVLSGDYTTTSETLADVDDDATGTSSIAFPVGANEEWVFDMILPINGNSSADMRFQTNGPTGVSCVIGYDEAETHGSSGAHDCGELSDVLSMSSTAETAYANGYVDTDSTSGTIQLQHRVNTDNGSTTYIYAGAYVNAFKISGADLAEIYYSKNGRIEPGTLLAADPSIHAGVTPTTKAYQDTAIGVVSTDPGLVIGDNSGQEGTPVQVALSGRVPVKVTDENGIVKAGDPLTASSTPGYAMKATKAGTIIGQALSDYNPETGMVTAFIKNGSGNGSVKSIVENPEDYDQNDFGQAVLRELSARKGEVNVAESDLSEVFTDRLAAAIEIITPTVTADEARLKTIKDLEDAGLTIDADTTVNGTLIVDTLIANNIVNGSEDGAVAPGETGEGTENDTVTDDVFEAQSAKIALDLRVMQTLFANGGLRVTGPADFLGESVFHRFARFIDRVVFDGDVEFAGTATFNKDTGGYAVIPEGKDEIRIEFEKAKLNPPVVTVTVKNGVLVPYAYKDLDEEGFTIVLAEAAKEDIEFSWTALDIKDAVTAEPQMQY